MSKKEFFNGCFPADWVEVDTKTEKEEVKQIQQRKDVATLLAELEEQGFPAYIDDKGQFDRVQVGRYRTLDEAATMERRLKMAGYPTVIVSIPL